VSAAPSAIGKREKIIIILMKRIEKNELLINAISLGMNIKCIVQKERKKERGNSKVSCGTLLNVNTNNNDFEKQKTKER